MKRIGYALLAITLAAFALRVFHLDAVSLRGDEAFTVIFVQRTWEGLWKGIRTIEPNPPLMYLALRGWIALAGAGEFATRYFSAFFGVLCVPLLYRLAREMFEQSPSQKWRLLRFARNDMAALFAALLIAINPYQIWHSQDVRNYTMWPALSLIALIFFWRWWKGEQKAEGGRRKVESRLTLLVFFVLAALASLYTHYYDIFILAALNLFVFGFALSARRRAMLARWIGAQVVLVLAYAPWVLFFTNRITTYGEASAEQSVSPLDQFSRTLATLVLSDTVPGALKALAWLPLALILFAILIYLARRNPAGAAFLFLCIAVPALALYVISIGRPLFLERYLNGIAAEYYLLFAIGIAALWEWPSRWRAPALALALFAVTGAAAYALANYYFDPAYIKSPDWRAVMQFINRRQMPGDMLIQNFTEMSPIYYRAENLLVLTVPRDYWARSEDERTLAQLNEEYDRIWFIPAAPGWWDDAQFVEKYLSRYADREIDTRVAEFRVQAYLTPRAFASKMIPLDARVGSATLVGYRVHGFEHEPVRLSSHATLRVLLYWRAAQKIEKDFTVFVHLTDASGRVIAQHDGAPAEGTYPTSQWQPDELIVDAHSFAIDAVPGVYSLIVGMYDPATLARAPVADGEDSVLLTQVMIAQ
jgi:4-amino-4-deoxy-L-arabinose transferase-like glycosyltransferase